MTSFYHQETRLHAAHQRVEEFTPREEGSQPTQRNRTGRPCPPAASRVDQGRRDSGEALALVLEWARTREDQQRAIAALTFKCDVLWALLDAVQQAGQQDQVDQPAGRRGHR